MEHESIQQKIAAHFEREETSSARTTLWKLRAARAGRILCRAAIVLSLLHYLWVLYRHPGQNTGDRAVSAAVNGRAAAVEPVSQTPPGNTPKAAGTGRRDTPAPAAEPRELGFEPFGPLHVILPRNSLADPLSVLDLGLLTAADCAANHAAIQSKDWGKLRRVISTRLRPAAVEWFSAGADAGDRDPEVRARGGRREAGAGGVRRDKDHALPLPHGARELGCAASGPERRRTAAGSRETGRGQRLLHGLGRHAGAGHPPEPLVALPPVTDTASLIDAEMRPHLNPKPLEDAQPGDFVALPLHAEVESVSEDGTVKGAILADKTRTEALPVEIRSAAGRRAGSAVTAGRRLAL